MQKERGRSSETKQEVICMKSAWRGWVARLSNVISLSLFNFPFIFHAMVSYWGGRVKGTFKSGPCAVSRMKGASPALSTSSLGKESIFPPSPSGFPGILPTTSTVHHSTHAFQMHLPLAVQTCCCESNCLDRPGSSGSCNVWNGVCKNPSLPSQGPLVTTCTSAVFCAILCNGRLPRIVGTMPSIFMPHFCKLLYRISYLCARSYWSIFEHFYEIKSFRGVSRHWALQQIASLCRCLLIAEVVNLWKPTENQNQHFHSVHISRKSFVVIVPQKTSASVNHTSAPRVL